MSGQVGSLYLLCFEARIGSGARHYLGWTGDVEKRVEDHRRGRGARLLRLARDLGVGFKVTRTWPNMTRADERRLKGRKNHAELCPACRLAHLERRNALQRERRRLNGRSDRP